MLFKELTGAPAVRGFRNFWVPAWPVVQWVHVCAAATAPRAPIPAQATRGYSIGADPPHLGVERAPFWVSETFGCLASSAMGACGRGARARTPIDAYCMRAAGVRPWALGPADSQFLA
eukprot:COSAG01_NODE_33599_length_561_cov_2.281385_1_plen_118_part_00